MKLKDPDQSADLIISFYEGDYSRDQSLVPYETITLHITAGGHTHSWSEDWSSNDTYHWHACDSCDERNEEGEHSFTLVIENGQIYKKCDTCGYKAESAEKIKLRFSKISTDWSKSVYNGKTDLAEGVILDFVLAGFQDGDTATYGVDYTVAGNFATPDAGVGKTITYTLTWLNDALAAKYDFDPLIQTDGQINRASVTINKKANTDGKEGSVWLYYGQTLGEADISVFEPSVNGEFSWDGTMSADENWRPYIDTPHYYTLYLLFTPEDTKNYKIYNQIIIGTEELDIRKTTPAMNTDAALSAAEINAGEALSASKLTFKGQMLNPYYPEGGAVLGIWSWKDGTQTVTESGEYTAVFKPLGTKAKYYNSVEVPVYVSVHQHDYGSEWKFDETGHWRECSCKDRTDEAEHDFEWKVSNGERYEQCRICQYKKDPVPKTELHWETIDTDWKKSVYDGSTSLEEGVITGVVLSGFEAGDDPVWGIDYTVTGTFETPDAGTEKKITYTITWLNDLLAAKYNLNPLIADDGIINKKEVDLERGTVSLYYGQTLGEAVLSGFTASADGAFTWNGEQGTGNDHRPLFGASSQMYLMFTPENPNYTAEQLVIGEEELNILQVTPVLDSGAELLASEVNAGDALSASALTFKGQMVNPYYPEGGAVPGVWSWKDGSRTVTEDGEYTAVFTPDDPTYYLPAEAEIQVKVHRHSYGDQWAYDENGHWHECSCKDRADEAGHSFSWIIDQEPSAEKKGIKHEECKICGYKKASVEIPATGKEPEPTESVKPTVTATPTEPAATATPSGQSSSKTTLASAKYDDAAKNPQTGDNTNLPLWMAAALASLSGAAGILICKKRKKNAE